ncbi:MAG: maleylpyruvate isomerase N-terminal domain-containing protein [Actinobacteria bacterium]|nr:maleylpyruvate isomerase N-terminal domain-containing protein [Actinomycetota bacterium]
MPTEALRALRAECEGVSRTVATLSEAAFALPTRCPAWNVKELLGHMLRDVDRINTALASPRPATADCDSVQYWRRYDPSPASPDSIGVAERGKEVAAAYATGGDLVRAWNDLWQAALRSAETAEPDRVVRTWGPALTLDELVRTRVVEITVHGMDLAEALGRGPWSTDGGRAITVGILNRLLDATPPSFLTWDEITFIEKGTGRRTLTEKERRDLGTAADRFPLLA